MRKAPGFAAPAFRIEPLGGAQALVLTCVNS